MFSYIPVALFVWTDFSERETQLLDVPYLQA